MQPWLLLPVSRDGPGLQDPDVVSKIWTWSWSTSFLLEQPLDPDFRWNPPIRKMNLPAATAQFPLPRAEPGWLFRRLHCCERAFNIWTWMSRNYEWAFHKQVTYIIWISHFDFTKAKFSTVIRWNNIGQDIFKSEGKGTKLKNWNIRLFIDLVFWRKATRWKDLDLI